MPSLSRLVPVLAAAAVVAGCSQAAGPSRPYAEVSQASGDLTVVNSKDGQAILRARGLAPGESARGTVSLMNTGTLAGDLVLEQVQLRDRPGPGGGLLSEGVQLAVRDVTNPADVITVFAGQLGVLDDRTLGQVAPSQSRTYMFTARLPDNGPPPSATGGDNAFNGSSLSVRYAWKATAPDQHSITPSSAPRVTFRVVKKRLLRRRRIDVVARCSSACTLTAWGMRPRTRRRTVRVAVARKRVRIKLKVPKRAARSVAVRVRRRGRALVRVRLRVTGATGGTRTYTKKVRISRRSPSRSRRASRVR